MAPEPRERVLSAKPLSAKDEKRSLASLVTSLPGQFIGLAKAEIASLKLEMMGKVKGLGVAVGLFAGAAFFALTMYCVLVAAAVMGLAEAFPGWLAALIVAGGFLIVTAILALVGIMILKKALPLKPEQTMKSIQQDVHAVKGVGEYE